MGSYGAPRLLKLLPKSKQIPSLKLKAGTWKWMVGRGLFPFKHPRHENEAWIRFGWFEAMLSFLRLVTSLAPRSFQSWKRNSSRFAKEGPRGLYGDVSKKIRGKHPQIASKHLASFRSETNGLCTPRNFVKWHPNSTSPKILRLNYNDRTWKQQNHPEDFSSASVPSLKPTFRSKDRPKSKREGSSRISTTNFKGWTCLFYRV